MENPLINEKSTYREFEFSACLQFGYVIEDIVGSHLTIMDVRNHEISVCKWKIRL